MNLAGSVIWGKAYMAPWTVWQLTPSMALNVSATSFAFFFNSARTWAFSSLENDYIEHVLKYVTNLEQLIALRARLGRVDDDVHGGLAGDWRAQA